MEAHLESGCGGCAGEVEWLRTVTALAAGAVEPPAELVAAAKEIFAPPQARTELAGWFDRLEALAASLVFAGTGDLLPMGVRGAASASERRVYKAGAFSIDLELGEDETSGDVSEIVGQISAEDPAVGLDRVVVQLRVAGKLLGETETNRFGEFVLQRPTSRATTLHFGLVGQGKRIDVKLPSEEEDRSK